jgi:signal transduction histidine kinase
VALPRRVERLRRGPGDADGRCVEAAVGLLRLDFDPLGEVLAFDREVTGETLTLGGDALLLRRLIRNLLENARVHAGGATGIRVSRHEGGARIAVEDAGPGVPPEDRDRIFEPFYRRREAGEAGTGLGLSIVRQIARVHGGDVQYTPRDGGGSRFVVTLPARSE